MEDKTIREKDREIIQKANEWFKLQIEICDNQIEYLQQQKERLKGLIQEDIDNES